MDESDFDIDKLIDLYSYQINYSQSDEVFVAKVLDWPLITSDGETATEAYKNIKKAVRLVIEDCIEQNDDFPKPKAYNANCEDNSNDF